MPRYSYSVYDSRGLLKRGALDAVSRQSALEVLRGRGLFPLDLVEETRRQATAQRWWEREISLGDGSLPLPALSTFTGELATLVKADLPLDQALHILAVQPTVTRRMRTVAAALLAAVREGQSLSGAMSGRGPEFPEYYWRLVQAGEASGALSDVLSDLARFLERSCEARAQIGSALLYPAILLLAAAAALFVILTVLVPTLVPLFRDSGAPLPLSLRVLVDAEAFVVSHGPLLLLALAGTVGAAIVLFRHPDARLAFDRTILRLPVVGSLISQRETARFCRTLGTLVHNGVPMLDAMRIAGDVMQNRAFASAVAEAGTSIQEGSGLSPPLLECGLFSELSLRLISVGEQAGQLEPMLMRVADLHETMLQRQVARLVSLMTPALTLVIGGMVGGLIMSVMNAILTINELPGL
jgi:general secretion pathway protein F